MAKKTTTSSSDRRRQPNIFWPAASVALLLAMASLDSTALGDDLNGPALTTASPVSSPAAPLPTSKADTVKDVRVAGVKSKGMSKILSCIHTRAGRAFDQELVDEDVKRLISTRQFVDVKPYLQRTPDGVIVIFDLLERPILHEVKIVGCLEIRKKRLLKEAMLKAGDPADPIMVEKGRRDMEEYYHKQGFTNAKVWVLEGDKPEDRRAIFVVNEGVKQKIWSFAVVGSTIVSGDRVLTQVSSSRPFLYLFGGELDRKKLDEDVEKITDYYRSLGFFRARVGREITFNDKGNWASITFIIDEGIRYKVHNVSIVGNRKYSTEQLSEDLKLNNSDYFNRASMKADQKMMQDKYGGVGYVFTTVKPDMRFLEKPGELDLVYNVSEGGRYRVGKINVIIKGDYSHTQENTVRNRLFFKPGDVVDIREIRASEAALKRSGIFETNVAEGTAPKVVLTPPGQDYDEPERKSKRQLAGGGRNGGPGGNNGDDGPLFRGQSPDDEDSRDRVVDVNIDCGRCVNPPPPSESIAPARQPSQPSASQPSAQNQPQPLANGANARLMAIGDARPQAAVSLPQNTAALPQDAVQNNIQNVQPDEGDAELRDLVRRDQAAATIRREQAGRQQQQQRPTPSQEGLRLPRVGIIETDEYTPSPGMANPAVNPVQPAVWTPSANNANNANAVQLTSNNAYPPYDPPASPNYGAPQSSAQNAPAAAGATAQPAPAYGQSMPQYSQAASNDPSQQPITPDDIFLTRPAPGADPLDTIQTQINTHEAMTGRVMFGVGVNSDAGLVGSVILDEQNFDWTRVPTSWEDIRNATAWRGAGQKFRIEAVPGTSVSRYSVTFQEPYAFGTNVSLGLNGYYYDRTYTEYEEEREGGRIALGYQFTPALSATLAYRGANVHITNAIDTTIPDLAAVNNRNFALHGFQVAVTNDRRDSAFLATEGYLVEASFEQVVGSFCYPRAELDMRKYFTLAQRPDGSGRQVLTLSGHVGVTGDNTPIYDRFFAGGFSSLRGFAYRGASPSVYSESTDTMCYLGGDFEVLASAEYMFPITADDMIRGVVFCDTGTVEETANEWHDKYRVAPGFGLRICVPAMGPAPIALDFAFPICWNPGDKGELFSFFVGFGR